VSDMAWMKRLAETYDLYQDLAGIVKDGQPVLLPVSHSTINAQIEVTLNEAGEFVMGKVVEKGDEVTIIPVTEDSAARSSGVAPHPLCDKLCYVAGDYSLFVVDGKKKKQDKTEYYNKYMDQLCKWVNSPFSHPMVAAIYQYLQKASLIQDLVDCGVLKLDENEMLDHQIKIHGNEQKEAAVRFQVYLPNEESRVWRNRELYEKYIQYYNAGLEYKDVCYVSGAIEYCTVKHPVKIRNTADKAKLISENDKTGFTYRGRFGDKNEAAVRNNDKTSAMAVGYTTSQKAHNALKWLLQKQGYRRDGSAFVSWVANRDVELPDIGKDSIHAYEKLIAPDGWESFFKEPVKADPYDTGKRNAMKLNKAMQGYAQQITMDDKVIMIALDAATTGRMSIAYYDEMGGTQYIDALQYWYTHCCWQRWFKYGKDKKGQWIVSAPSLREIALTCYGVLREKTIESDDNVLRLTIKRLLPCITKQAELPKDLIRAAVVNTSRPLAYYNTSNGFFLWKNQMLSVTCAMIRYQYEKRKGDGKMNSFLEDNASDRNVLFGRLLAIYDYMEEQAMPDREEKGHQTNAKRYWNSFSMRPATTLKTLQSNLVPYRRKLNSYQEYRFDQWIEQIMVQLAENGYDNRALSENYLPGYYLQMKMMREHFSSRTNKEE